MPGVCAASDSVSSGSDSNQYCAEVAARPDSKVPLITAALLYQLLDVVGEHGLVDAVRAAVDQPDDNGAEPLDCRGHVAVVLVPIHQVGEFGGEPREGSFLWRYWVEQRVDVPLLGCHS